MQTKKTTIREITFKGESHLILGGDILCSSCQIILSDVMASDDWDTITLTDDGSYVCANCNTNLGHFNAKILAPKTAEYAKFRKYNGKYLCFTHWDEILGQTTHFLPKKISIQIIDSSNTVCFFDKISGNAITCIVSGASEAYGYCLVAENANNQVSIVIAKKEVYRKFLTILTTQLCDTSLTTIDINNMITQATQEVENATQTQAQGA